MVGSCYIFGLNGPTMTRLSRREKLSMPCAVRDVVPVMYTLVTRVLVRDTVCFRLRSLIRRWVAVWVVARLQTVTALLKALSSWV